MSFVDIVFEASTKIEETTLMREHIKGDEASHKKRLIDWFLHSDDEKMEYRIPNQASSFELLQRKARNHVCQGRHRKVTVVV